MGFGTVAEGCICLCHMFLQAASKMGYLPSFFKKKNLLRVPSNAL